MKKNISLSESALSLLYFKYKKLIFSSFLFFTSAFIIFQVLIPQVKNYFEFKEKIKDSRKKIDILKNNYTFSSNLNEYNLNSDLDVVSLALPTEKDFASILNSISDASNNSGVDLSDYSFNVGDLSSESAEIKTESYIQIDLEAGGSINSLKNFLFELSTKFPLSESVTFETGQTKSSVVIYFYHKPFQKIPYDLFSPFTPRKKNEEDLIKKLTSLNLNRTLVNKEENSLETEEISLDEENLELEKDLEEVSKDQDSL